MGEESKPEPAAKRPPKTAQPSEPNCASAREGVSAGSIKAFIEAKGDLVKYPG